MSDRKIMLMTFLRSVEPRMPELDMLKPLQHQVEELKKRDLTATFLFQYDALSEDRFVDLVKNEPSFEKGLWLETVQPQVEAAGLKWRGRFPWDWHAHCGFLVGYTPEERILLIDEAFSLFKKRFGYYPTAVGSWIIDAFSLRYMERKYKIRAAAICREQWGMDGYSLWGGYYSQGYYPCDKNVLCPAASLEHMIGVPVFRKSNSDPIYDYDFDLDYEKRHKGLRVPLTTMEACCDHGGADPTWVDWMLSINQGPYATPFGLVDIGQENSFSWESMEKGILLDYERADTLRKAGKADLVTLTQLGDWYRDNFKKTPCCCLYADKDSEGTPRGTLWYQSPYYRVNFYFDDERLWIRDMHLYDESYEERYLSKATSGNTFCYDALPVAEGRLWSDEETRAGIYIWDRETDAPVIENSKPLICDLPDKGKMITKNTLKGKIIFELRENSLTVRLPKGLLLRNVYLKTGDEPVPFVSGEGNILRAVHDGFAYSLKLSKGNVQLRDEDLLFVPDEEGVICIDLS